VDVVERAKGWKDRGLDLAETAYRRWPLLEFPLELFRRFIRVNASVLAGHLAFRVFVFIVPLLLVLVAGLGFASSSGVDVAEQGENVRIGTALASSIADTGNQAEQSKYQVGLIGLLALVTATSGLVAALRLVVATVWEIPVKEAPTTRVKTMGWLLPGVLIVFIGMGIRQWLSQRGLVLEGLGALIAIAINSVCLLGLFWILPRRTKQLLDLVPGAVAAAVGFAALNIASAVYFTDKLQKSSEVYGTLGVAVTVLVYLFFVGQIIVISSLVNTIWFDREQILERVRAGGSIWTGRAAPEAPSEAGPTAASPALDDSAA